MPCLPVSSLQAVAQAAFELHQRPHVLALTDARMNQVYAGEYAVSDGIMQLVAGATEHLLDYDSVIDKDLALVGNGATLVNAQLGQAIFADIHPSAVIIAKLGLALYQQHQSVPAELALPVYLRNNAWKTLAEQQKT